MRKIICGALLLLALNTTASAVEAKDSVMVFAPASLKEALKELARDLRKEQGIEVSFNFGGSKNLRLQIEQGMPCDIFIASEKESITKLTAAEMIDPEASVKLLEDRLVVIGAKNSDEEITSLFDLKFRPADSLSLADPNTESAGVFARQALEKAGVYDKIKPYIVPSLDVRAAMSLVEAGNAKYAIVFATDAKVAKRAKVVYQVPSKLYDRIIYTAALMKKGTRYDPSHKFLAYLQSDHSRMVFEKYGFYRLSQ